MQIYSMTTLSLLFFLQLRQQGVREREAWMKRCFPATAGITPSDVKFSFNDYKWTTDGEIINYTHYI